MVAIRELTWPGEQPFADASSSTSCQTCPINAATLNAGSTAASLCVCNPGFFGLAGGIQCLACAPGSFSFLQLVL